MHEFFNIKNTKHSKHEVTITTHVNSKPFLFSLLSTFRQNLLKVNINNYGKRNKIDEVFQNTANVCGRVITIMLH